MSASRHFFALISQPNRFFCIKRPGGSAVFWSPRPVLLFGKWWGGSHVPPRLAGRLPRRVGEGHGPPADPCVAASPAGRCEHRPLQRLRYRRGCGFPFGCRPLPPSVGADSISARGAPRRRKPGRYGIGPYRGCANAEVAAYGVASGLVIGRRGGIHPTRGTLRQRGLAVGCGVCPAP